ncbi:FtsX-like permease family protein [Nonomuraea sp. NN258]|nr:FtsX-like permease family protein [Nonomuraea antri]
MLGVVVFCSTVAIIIALGLIEPAAAPFDRAFDRQHGAHAVAAFDPTAFGPAASDPAAPDPAEVGADRLARTAARPGVAAVAGPFEQAAVTVADTGQSLPPGPLTVVGRADPGGPVDRVELWAGRWARAAGEIVLNRPSDGFFAFLVGTPIKLTDGRTLTVVGLASSLTGTAESWVTPEQVKALRPDVLQVLYRFDRADTDAEVRASVAAATAGLPAGALLGTQSYLTLKRDAGRLASAYLPFLLGFGVLALVVAVLIVANVVSGAVVAGRRSIGVLKALGFTPNQVVAVHLIMVLVPAVAGCVLGAALGGLAAQPLLRTILQGVRVDVDATLSPWVFVVTLLGMPAVVVAAALVPAMSAHRLPAGRAISAGSAPGAGRGGRGRRVQRWLAGTRLARSVSLGLGLPFARPARSALTLAAVVLGVGTVTLAAGLAGTMTAYGAASQRAGHVQSVVHVGQPGQGGQAPRHTDAEIESLLRALPGTAHVTADAWLDLHLAGSSERVMAQFFRGDSARLGETIVRGRWLRGPGEAVVPSPFLDGRGLAVGDRLTLTMNGRRAAVTIVGQTMAGSADLIQAHWGTLTALAPAAKANQYEVGLTPGTDVAAYNAAVRAADPGLRPVAKSASDSSTVTVVGSATLLTVLLGTVAALGVFNTVVLNTRERRRDLGMLKSIGMTPRQVTVMTVTSMAALGAAGGLLGLPIGAAAHRLIVPAMAEGAGVVLPPAMIDVWDAPTLALLAPSGVVIAVLGALVPARAAVRLTIAAVLHNE